MPIGGAVTGSGAVLAVAASVNGFLNRRQTPQNVEADTQEMTSMETARTTETAAEEVREAQPTTSEAESKKEELKKIMNLELDTPPSSSATETTSCQRTSTAAGDESTLAPSGTPSSAESASGQRTDAAVSDESASGLQTDPPAGGSAAPVRDVLQELHRGSFGEIPAPRRLSREEIIRNARTDYATEMAAAAEESDTDEDNSEIASD